VDDVLLEVQHVSKAFPGVRALDDVSLTVTGGEVLALVGHNGSGKSTLVKILAGVYDADAGSVVRHDAAGVAPGLHFIHQDLGLVPMLSAVENIDLARTHRMAAVLPSPRRRERSSARQRIAQFGAAFDVDIPVARLSPAERTIVALARALDGWESSRNVLVLDEPTAALAEGEVRKLFDAIRTVTAGGAGVVMISHRLDEVVELADSVVVLRDGKVVADERRGAFDQRRLVSLIAGSEDGEAVEIARHNAGGEVMLAVSGLTGTFLSGVDLDVRAGEIVGVTGLLGSGIEQLCSIVFGAVPATGGSVQVAGSSLRPGPRRSIRAGMGFAPADRRRLGSVLVMNARENLTLPRLAPVRGRLGQIRRKAERDDAGSWMQRVDVRPAASTERGFALFSGGNQQKIVIAKWVRNEPRVLLLEEPTQGVDVAAQAGIHQLIARVASRGTAVLVASTDAKELAALCHRVLVLHRGRVAAVLEGDRLSESALVRATLHPHDATAVPAADGSTSTNGHR
jgi:ABC-type sugar transport system ATPase subunit